MMMILTSLIRTTKAFVVACRMQQSLLNSFSNRQMSLTHQRVALIVLSLGSSVNLFSFFAFSVLFYLIGIGCLVFFGLSEFEHSALGSFAISFLVFFLIVFVFLRFLKELYAFFAVYTMSVLSVLTLMKVHILLFLVTLWADFVGIHSVILYTNTTVIQG